MKKNIVIPIVLILVIITAALFFSDSNSVYLETKKTESQQKSSENNVSAKKKIQEQHRQVPVEIMSDYIKELNKLTTQDLSYYAGGKNMEVAEFYVDPRDNTDDVIVKIKEYFSNFAENQIQIGRLMIHCGNLNEHLDWARKKINEKNAVLNEMLFNKFYFNQGLYDIGICKTMGTKKDPFWGFLKLARGGDEIAQLLLLQNIVYASYEYRKTINIKKYPMEYMQLRDEAIGYLQQLAAKRVYRAAERLGRLYSGRGWDLVPKNPLLAYYYYYLANSTNDFERKPFDENLDVFYKELTDKQKQIVDRMTENL